MDTRLTTTTNEEKFIEENTDKNLVEKSDEQIKLQKVLCFCANCDKISNGLKKNDDDKSNQNLFYDFL